MKEEKISPLQAVMLLTGFFLGSIVVMNGAAMSGEDAWFSYLVGWLGGFFVICITAAIAALHPGRSIIEILIFCFGKKVGKILGLLYVAYFLWLAGQVIRTFCYYSNTTDYTETPSVFIAVCYMLLIAFIVRIGLEVLGRISEVLIVVMLIIVSISMFGIAAEFQPDAFLPILKDGIMKPAVSGLSMSMLPFGEGLIALSILPNLNDHKKTFKVMSLSVIVAGSIMFILMLRDITILGVPLAARNIFPSEKTFRLMPGLNIYPLLDINVIITGTLKVGLSIYAAVKSLGEIFGLKDFKILVLPIAALDIALEVTLHHSIFDQLFFARNIVPLIDIPGLLILPIVMLVVSLVKRSDPHRQLLKLE